MLLERIEWVKAKYSSNPYSGYRWFKAHIYYTVQGDKEKIECYLIDYSQEYDMCEDGDMKRRQRFEF